MSAIPPVGDPDPSDRPIRDRTPEPDQIAQRTVTPVAGPGLASGRIGALVAIAAVIAALVFINVGSSGEPTTNTMAMSPAAQKREDLRARQVAKFDDVPTPPPALNGPRPATGATALPDGTVVPAIESAEAGFAPEGSGQTSGETLAEKMRRAPMFTGSVSSPSRPPIADAALRGGADDPDLMARQTSQAEPPGELDRLRKSSAIGSSRAGLLPNRNYLVTAGTLIPCILQTAINSTQPGFTSCVVPRDVFSDNGKVVLLEKGTRVVGQYQGGINQGQNRIFVLWTRAVTPRGVAIDLASPASDALGRAGMAGAVDTFFWARFGAALMLSLVDDASSIAAAHFANEGSNTTQVPSNTASTALQGTIAIKPVLTKNQGEEVGIFVAQDFNFSAVYNLEPRP